jgi:hypothetical protein
VESGHREQERAHGDQRADPAVAVSEGEHHHVRRPGREQEDPQVRRLAAEEAGARAVVGSVTAFGSVHVHDDPKPTLRRSFTL